MDCIFCKIINGEIPGNFIYEDEKVVAFEDINPQAPVHFLIVPKEHIKSNDHIDETNSHIIGHIFRIARRLAEEKKRIRFEFIRVLGHELKAPIGAVSNYLSLMRKRTLGQEIVSYDEVIERSQVRLDQMQKLVVDLLDMTRIESGQRVRELTSLDLVEIAKRSTELVEGAAQSRGISIHIQSPSTLDVQADRNELEMVLNNLVSNAVKYNRDGGRVEVQLEREGDYVRISVSDTGIGMTGEESAKLFGEFVRIKNEKTVKILGSGLGLSIVSTPKGVMSDAAARTANVGGEVLCTVF